MREHLAGRVELFAWDQIEPCQLALQDRAKVGVNLFAQGPDLRRQSLRQPRRDVFYGTQWVVSSTLMTQSHSMTVAGPTGKAAFALF